MGSRIETDPDRNHANETQHEVMLTSAFWILEHEVTQGEYHRVMGSKPSEHKLGDNYPVEMVTWNDAKEFCDRLTLLDRGQGRISSPQRYRLPTEAEWEYACRAGTTTAVYYNTGNRKDELDAIAWWKNNSVRRTQQVAGKTRNQFGLHDMIGNVSEWCADLSNSYPVDYQNSQELNPTGPTTGSYRVIRGGSFSSPQNELRAAYRSSLLPNKRSAAIGFRPVLAAE